MSFCWQREICDHRKQQKPFFSTFRLSSIGERSSIGGGGVIFLGNYGVNTRRSANECERNRCMALWARAAYIDLRDWLETIFFYLFHCIYCNCFFVCVDSNCNWSLSCLWLVTNYTIQNSFLPLFLFIIFYILGVCKSNWHETLFFAKSFFSFFHFFIVLVVVCRSIVIEKSCCFKGSSFLACKTCDQKRMHFPFV